MTLACVGATRSPGDRSKGPFDKVTDCTVREPHLASIPYVPAWENRKLIFTFHNLNIPEVVDQ